MAQTGFPPKDWQEDERGQFLTFIVPAPGGCNLNCPFCVIVQRREISRTLLYPADYARFIVSIAATEKVVAVGLQGYEPLLPAARPYTEAILAASASRGIPTSLVTNGIYLLEALPLLQAGRLARIGVSLDAADASRHDRLRGRKGAWQATVGAIAASAAPLAASGVQVSVISVLMPGGRDRLSAMPALLRGLGVTSWVIDPLTILGRGIWSSHEAGARLVEDLLALNALAQQHGIALTVDDEMGYLQSAVLALSAPHAAGLNMRTLPAGVTLSRLTPAGQCSVGHDIARPMPPQAARWHVQSEHPAEFLRARRNAEAGTHLSSLA